VILNPSRHRVAADEVRAEDFGEASLHRPPPEIHLKQAVSRLDESLRKEEIVARGRDDVRHTPAIADDADGRRDAIDLERAGHRR
jgi:hypothetical protein